MDPREEELALLKRVLEIYDQKYVAEYLSNVAPGAWCRETINRWLNGKASPRLGHAEYCALEELLPKPPAHHPNYDFDFIDLFAGMVAYAAALKL